MRSRATPAARATLPLLVALGGDTQGHHQRDKTRKGFETRKADTVLTCLRFALACSNLALRVIRVVAYMFEFGLTCFTLHVCVKQISNSGGSRFRGDIHF